jgi:hypothetical protein
MIRYNNIERVMLTSAPGALVKNIKVVIFILETTIFLLFKH